MIIKLLTFILKTTLIKFIKQLVKSFNIIKKDSIDDVEHKSVKKSRKKRVEI